MEHLYVPEITYLSPNMLKTKSHNKTTLAHASRNQKYFGGTGAVLRGL